jgi:hypothetical protein
MKIQIKSLQLLERLQQIKQRAASVGNIGVTLQVPDDLFWWVFLEFGTGKYRDNDPTEGYEIHNVIAKFLTFISSKTGEKISVESVFMPGIPAFHMITSIYDDILSYQRSFIAQTLIESNYDMEAVKELIVSKMMPKIKEMIIDSFSENLPNHERELGRLSVTATQAFEEGLEIV